MFLSTHLDLFFDNFRINNEGLFHIEKRVGFSVLQQVSASAVAMSGELCLNRQQ